MTAGSAYQSEMLVKILSMTRMTASSLCANVVSLVRDTRGKDTAKSQELLCQHLLESLPLIEPLPNVKSFDSK